MSPAVRLERSGPNDVVARVTLQRPDVHNAFDASVIAELRSTFAAIAREDAMTTRVVVLAGDGPSFCAGADIAWMRAAMALDVEGNEQDAMAMADMFEAIDTCPAPVIARVHGAALGGGMGLCAVADIVITESGARFGFTETRLGILPAVIAPFVVAKIGETQARALFPGGRRFDAVRAQRIGLVHEVVEGEAALDAAVDVAVDDVLAAGPNAARAAKAIVREVRGLSHGSSKWHTARVIARQRVSAEAREGFAAFDEKRRPAWGTRPRRSGRVTTEPPVGRNPASGVVERVAPSMLGRDFRWLWGQRAITNLGDGIVLSAGPLLMTTLTQEPFAIAMAVFFQQLPWVIFGIPAGAIIDRVDRRRLVVLVNVLRAIVLAVLALSVATGSANLVIVLTAVFLIGVAETFTDNASGALLATSVPKLLLGVANARLTGTSIVTNQLAGPPLGALLFTVGNALPFGADAVCALLGAAFVARIAATPRPDPVNVERRHIRHEISDGMRWLWHHPPVRALALTIFFFNVTFGAAMAVYVLLAKDRLGLDDLGYGLLLTLGAVGGLIGSAAYPRLERRFSLATLMRYGLVLETLTHLILAMTTSALVAAATMTLFGIHAVTWGTTSETVRQRAVPSSLLGRVTSVYMIGAIGGSALGAIVGGLLAQRFGVTAPFWFGFFGSAILLVVIWGTLDDIAHAPIAEPDGP